MSINSWYKTTGPKNMTLLASSLTAWSMAVMMGQRHPKFDSFFFSLCRRDFVSFKPDRHWARVVNNFRVNLALYQFYSGVNILPFKPIIMGESFLKTSPWGRVYLHSLRAIYEFYWNTKIILPQTTSSKESQAQNPPLQFILGKSLLRENIIS